MMDKFRHLVCIGALPMMILFIGFAMDGTCQANPYGWVAFDGWFDGDRDIWAVRDDGSGVMKQLTDLAGQETTPEWSPDSMKIAYATGRGGQIRVYDWFTGSDELIYDGGKYSTYFPTWSPDGSKILFREEASYNNPRIMMINSDGSGAVEEIPVQSGYVGEPSWSPSGAAFVYNRRNSGASFSADMWIYDFTDGTNQRLTQGAGSESTTKYTPDWTQSEEIVLAWGHNLVTLDPGESPDWRDPPVSDLSSPYVTVLTDDASYPSRTYYGPSWSPDLSQIAYGYYSGGVLDLQVMDAFGGNRYSLMAEGEHPDWGNPVPVPGAVLLGGIGVGLVGCWSKRKAS